MRTSLLTVIACLCLVQCLQATPGPQGGGAVQLDPEDMVKHMTPECVKFMMQPASKKNMEAAAKSGIPSLLEFLHKNKCDMLANYLGEKLGMKMKKKTG